VILFYVVYRVLLSLTKSILEKKRKRAVFHKLIIPFYNESLLVGAKKETDFEREEKSAKKTTKKRRLSLLPFFMCPFFRAFLCF
jgi:hypothetical protein